MTEGMLSCQTSISSTLDSEMSADSKDPNKDGDWCELPQLIVSRNKLRTEINDTETRTLTLEQEICENRACEEKTLCGTCGLVREPRQRKIAELRLMHQAMLKSKPKHLLCTAGMITRLESMILEGFLDCGSNKVNRCRECHQENNQATLKSYLISEVIDILEDQRSNCTKTENCSMTEACSACLDFMLSQLKNPDMFKIQDDDSNDRDDSSFAQNATHHSNVTAEHKDKTSSILSHDATGHSNVATESTDTQKQPQDDFVAFETEAKITQYLDQNDTQHSDLKDETKPIMDQDDSQHSRVSIEPKDETTQISYQVDTKYDIPAELKDKSTPILDEEFSQDIGQDDTQYFDVLPEPIDETAPIIDTDDQHSNVPTKPGNETTLVPVQDVTNDEVKKVLVQDCQLHPYVDPATVLFKNIFTKQLESLTAELDKIYVEQMNQEENQKDLVTEMTQLKEKLQDHENMYPELPSYKKFAAMLLQMKERQKNFVTTEQMQTEFKIQQDGHEKLTSKMDQLTLDLIKCVTPEKLKAELAIDRKCHNVFIAKLDRLNEKLQHYATTESMQAEWAILRKCDDEFIAKLDRLNEKLQNYAMTESMQAELAILRKCDDEFIAKLDRLNEKSQDCVQTEPMQAILAKYHKDVNDDIIAQVNNYFEKHIKDWVTKETFQTKLTKHADSQNALVANVNNYIAKHAKECVSTKAMQLESSKHEKTQQEHLDKLNAIQVQLARLEDSQKKLQAEFSDQKYKQSKKILDLQMDVGSLKRNQGSHGLASAGSVNGLNTHSQNRATSNPYRQANPIPYPRPH